MTLSFKERNQIRKQVGLQTARLGDAEGLTFKEKNGIRKEVGQLLAQLEAAIDKNPEVKNEKLQALIKGEYNKEKPEKFLAILKEIVDEIRDVEPVKEPTIKFIETNQEAA